MEPDSGHPLTQTAQLLTQVVAGDADARAEILWRYREPLVRFLHGRLSLGARGPQDTEDIVQSVLATALGRIQGFEYRGLGSFWCYLRTIGINLIRSEERRRGAHPAEQKDSAVVDAAPDRSPDPLEDACSVETFAAFERAMQELAQPAREAVLLRLELGLPYEAIAAECGYSSPDAARVAIARGLAVVARRLSGQKP